MDKILNGLKVLAFSIIWLCFGFGFACLAVMDGLGAFSLS